MSKKNNIENDIVEKLHWSNLKLKEQIFRLNDTEDLANYKQLVLRFKSLTNHDDILVLLGYLNDCFIFIDSALQYARDNINNPELSIRIESLKAMYIHGSNNDRLIVASEIAKETDALVIDMVSATMNAYDNTISNGQSQ